MDKERPSPTRMELMAVKDRIALARKGYQLIKQKRDVLVVEVMSIMQSALTLRQRLDSQSDVSYKALAAAQAQHGVIELENTAMSVRKSPPILITVRNAMGVMLPVLNLQDGVRRLPDRGYSIPYTSAKVDEVADNFERILRLALELADKEVSMRKLMLEIEKTKRRVNALDKLVIPWLQESQAEISLKLEEMERDDLITLKTIKGQMERRAASEASAGNG